MVITKEELNDQDWWNQNLLFTEENPSDGERSVSDFSISIFFVSDTSYERLLSVFVGSYYVCVRTLTSDVPQNVVTEDLVNTRDALSKYFFYFTHCLSVSV